MSLGHRWIWAIEVMAVALVGSGALSCGDDEPPRDQAVLWLELGTPLGQTCSQARTFSLPDQSARAVIVGGNGVGERLVDGSDDSFVECTVSEEAAGQFNLQFNLQSGEIGSFNLSGPITMSDSTNGQGTFTLYFNTSSFSLQQEGCTATIKQALAGAVWINSLSCPTLVDRSSPGVRCTGNGGLIAENCSR